MRSKLGSVSIAVVALALTGCVVQPIDGQHSQQQPQQPAYQPAPQFQRLQVEGPWQLRERGRFVRAIDVRRVRGGVEISGARRTFFAQRVGPGVFQDERGRTYQFISDFEGRFDNPNNGRSLRLRRP